MKETRKFILTAFVMFVVLTLAAGCSFAARKPNKPKLILQITIDQMRGDFPMRYKDRLGEGGFRYLMEEGCKKGVRKL